MASIASSDDFSPAEDKSEEKICSPSLCKVEGDNVKEDVLLRDPACPSLEFESTQNITCHQNFGDCCNVFKGFIGSAMVGLPFATLQSGIGFALLGFFVIVSLTDHCCILIVRCKKLIIKDIIDAKRLQGTDEVTLKEEENALGRGLSFGKIGKTCLGKSGALLINISLMVTQFGFSIGYFIFLGNTMRSILKYYFLKNHSSNTTAQHTTTLPTIFNYFNTELTLSISEVFLNSVGGFAIFLILPLILLILIAFIRNLRSLGPTSVIANACMTVAFVATASFILINDMKALPDPILWFKVSTFPIFFGQITASFEGIGTVIPIEGSMSENRSKYPGFLHISLLGITFILASFGIIGYLAFGTKTCQIITGNLDGPIAIALQILLYVGVLFTYPLQIYPCIQITEHLIVKFRRWKIVREAKFSRLRSESEDEKADPSVDNTDQQALNNVKLKRWEANIVRALLVTFTALIALVFRFQFAYISALTGSIGSSMLSYIIPALIHIRLTKSKIWVRVKDIFLILFGIIGGVCGVTVTIMELIASFNSSQPAHC